MICMTKMNRGMMGRDQRDLNLQATELRLGLPGSDECHHDMTSVVAKNNKRASRELTEDSESNSINSSVKSSEIASGTQLIWFRAHIVVWPPVRSYLKNNIEAKNSGPEAGGMYVTVSMDEAPYLRKMDLKVYNGYSQLFEALETMFKFSMERKDYKGSKYASAYEDKDGDLMLVGDVPWEMFKSSCKTVRIMRGIKGKGLGFGVIYDR